MLRLDHLNTEQRQAVENISGPQLVLAGAGTGKTNVLTHRIAHMLACGIPGRQIVAMTFTNKAAREMKERVEKLVEPGLAKDVFVGTFHSYCLLLLRKYAKYCNRSSRFHVQDASGQLTVVKAAMKELKISDKEFNAKIIQAEISRAKNDMLTPQQLRIKKNDQFFMVVATVYQTYNRLLEVYNSFDFDDLILEMVMLLEKHDDVRAGLQERVRHYLLDEFQDTNPSQFALVKYLVGPNCNIFAVGDDDQSIYSWRGADPETMNRFLSDYPKSKLVKLEQNYRSTQVILEAANGLIEKNRNRLEKSLWSDRETTHPITVVPCLNPQEEAGKVVEDILVEKHRAHVPWSHFGVIYRTNGQAREIEEACRTADIPYRLIGGQQFFDKKEVKDILSYLRLLVDDNDDVSLMRVVNYPNRGLGLQSVEKISQLAKRNNRPFFSTMRNLQGVDLSASADQAVSDFVAMIDRCRMRLKENTPPLRVLRDLLIGVHFDNAIRKESKNPSMADKKFRSIESLFESIANYFERRPLACLDDYLSFVTLDDQRNETSKDESDVVTLLTIHAAKGLEYEFVYVIGMEEDILPHERSMGSVLGVSEERRLCYVAITRARRRLMLSYVKERKRGCEILATEPSQFLSEIPESCLDSVVEGGVSKEQRIENSAQSFFTKFLKE